MSPALARAQERYYRYLVEQMDLSQSAFRWQFASTIVIFFVVMLLVACGVVVSLVQIFFGLGFFEPRRPDQSTQRVRRRFSWTTKLKIGVEGAEVETQIAGIVLLVLSLGFFYLYVENVYPIRVVAELPLPAESGRPASGAILVPGGAGSARPLQPSPSRVPEPKPP